MTGAIIFAGVFGALIGSFLNVVVHRVPLGESLVTPGSRCPACGTPVAPYDNVPVLSWIVLRGRCRSCGVAISARYPLVELLTAVVFAAVVGVRGFDEQLALELPFAAVLIACALIDLEHRLIPNRIVVPAAIYGVAVGALVDLGAMPERLGAGAGGFLMLLAVALIRPGGMGMGDVKLVGMMGLYLGLSIAPALLLAFLAGSLVGVAILARGASEGRKTAVPFGPFLALGGLVGLLAGPELIGFYSDHFL